MQEERLNDEQWPETRRNVFYSGEYFFSTFFRLADISEELRGTLQLCQRWDFLNRDMPRFKGESYAKAMGELLASGMLLKFQS